MTTATKRTAPHSDLEAEEAVLGAALLAPAAYDDAIDAGLTPHDFYKPAHGHIFDAISHLVGNAAAVDPVTVTARLRSQGLLDDIGGLGTVISLQASTPGVTGAAHHARLIIDAARLRRLRAAALEIEARLDQPIDDADATVTWAETTMQAAVDHTDATKPEPVSDLMPAWLTAAFTEAQADRPLGIFTPWARLNEFTGGFRPGQLIVIGARPGVGKSAWMLNLAAHTATHGQPTLICSLEMSTPELLERLVAQRTGLNHSTIRDKTFGPHDYTRIGNAVDDIKAWPLHIHSDPDMTVARIASAARRVPGLALVIVDYTQLITPPPTTARGDQREAQVAAIVTGLKRLARRIEKPIVALAQLNRESESRTDKRPKVSDFRESGKFEADADLLVGLYRDELYHPKSKDRGVMELSILKQRSGPAPRTVRAGWSPETGQIGDLTQRPDEPPPDEPDDDGYPDPNEEF